MNKIIPNNLRQTLHYLDKYEVAKILNCTFRTVVKKAAAGKVPGAFFIGHEWRFCPEMLADWLEGLQRRNTPSAAAEVGLSMKDSADIVENL